MRLRSFLIGACITCGAVSGATSVAAQADPQKASKPTSKASANKPTVMSGCVSANDVAPRQLTFTDANDGSRYRLTGTDVTKYLGRRIEIIGNLDNRRLRIAGGLMPTPNAAAQAGALDPARAAVAAAGGGTTGTGTPVLPDFRVTRVNAIAGDCPR